MKFAKLNFVKMKFEKIYRKNKALYKSQFTFRNPDPVKGHTMLVVLLFSSFNFYPTVNPDSGGWH